MNDRNDELPFFVRFLEGQDYPELETGVQAGPGGGHGGGGRWRSHHPEVPLGRGLVLTSDERAAPVRRRSTGRSRDAGGPLRFRRGGSPRMSGQGRPC